LAPCLLYCCSLHHVSAALHWEALQEGISAWAEMSFDADFAVNVGDHTGTLFEWSTPGFSMDTTRMPGASLSKWPASVMISGLVNDGIMSFDDRVNKYVTWWAKEDEDPRSKVTLRHLLSFTSGYLDDADVKCASKNGDFMDCAHQLYNASAKYEAPGRTWQYLSCHLQFAGAMAVAASGVPIHKLFEKYLYRPFNMTSTTWDPPKNPSVAAGITTTGRDFENYLKRLLTYEVLPKSVLDEMETDLSKAPISPSGDGWFGHYGMGHWWECIGYGTPRERTPLPPVCTEAHVQAGPGMYGFYPLVDRSGGGGAAGPSRPEYYMQVVLAEFFDLSGIPEYLRIMTKPVVDVILAGGDPSTWNNSALLEQGAGLLPRDISDIKSALKRCSCAKSKLWDFGEPYKSLGAGMPKDDPKMNRRQIAAAGVGLLLHDLVKVQKKLGHCKCVGRRK